MDRHRSPGYLDVAVLPDPQGSRPQLVGEPRYPRGSQTDYERGLRARPPSDVFGVLVMGDCPSPAFAQLDRGPGRDCRLRNLVFRPGVRRRAPDAEGFW